MKQSILVFFLCCLLLNGCAVQPQPEPTTSPTFSTEETIPEPTGLYDSEHPVEAATGGALRCFPLDGIPVSGVIPMGQSLLLFSRRETGTCLTVLEGAEAYESASLELNYYLNSQNTSLRVYEDGLSFCHPESGETVVLDRKLREISRFPAPKDLLGTPLLSENRRTLYYCTPSAVRVLDLETGISRCLKEISCSYQSVTGLWMNDTVLECSIADGDRFEILFLSTKTGEILDTAGSSLNFAACGQQFYASFPNGSISSFVFGSMDKITALNTTGDCYFLPEDHAAVTVSQPKENQTVLDYYDLASGLRTASLTLDTGYCPWNFGSLSDGLVIFLNYDEANSCYTLYCWDTTVTPANDNAVYTGTHYTREIPDYDGLASCQLYAQQISEKYGIEVLIYKDAAAVQPWDYDLEYEYLVPVIQKELENLDARLGNYPEGFLDTLAKCFDGIQICIVRSLTGTAESGSLDAANGIQFMDGYTARIALSAEMDTEYALYHEMCHLIDTVVITKSGAYDRWDQLNPKGFAYDYDYIANQSRCCDEYLQQSNRSFIDTYAMSFPKEDRARIMEYAMTPGNEDYFVSLAMQSKLKLLCEGIREAFGLRKSPETFLWEQYLNTSLAYTK